MRYNDPTGHCIPYIGDCRPVWETGQGLNVHDFQEYSAGVVEGMGSLGASVASLAKAETWQSAARGRDAGVSDPGAAAGTVAQAAIDQGKAVMRTVAAAASDPAGAAAALNDDPRALGRTLGQAAGNLALAKVMKDVGGGEGEGGGSCGLNSFRANTLVATTNGEQPIGTLQVGDQVLAYDQTTGTTGIYTITTVWVNLDPVLVDLSLDGEQIETTPHHPFYTSERGWVDAGTLWIGAHIRNAAGRTGTVSNVVVVQRPQLMYNLTVATAHTFFVGGGRWLVHNHCNPLHDRALELHNEQGHFLARALRTTAVTKVRTAAGQIRYLVSSSQTYLPSEIEAALGANEIPVTGIVGHAEESALEYAAQNGLTPLEVAASRDICPSCAAKINAAGAIPVSPLQK